MPYWHPSCSCAAFGGSSPSNRGSFRAWQRAEGGADSLPPLDEFMGCDIGSQGSLCSKERGRRLLYLFMKQFIWWGGSHRTPRGRRGLPGLHTHACGGAEPRVLPGRWVPAGAAAEGLPPLCSARHAAGVVCVHAHACLVATGRCRGLGCPRSCSSALPAGLAPSLGDTQRG